MKWLRNLDIKTYPFVPGMIAYQGQYCGTDTPGSSVSSIKEFHEYPIQDFDYQFNSWGFRGEDFEQYLGDKVNICLGDSITVNIGGPVEHSWCSQLAEHFDIPTLNLGMNAAGNDAIKLVCDRACELFNVQNIFVMYSYLPRRLVDGRFKQHTYTDYKEDLEYFLEHRIPNAYECALPLWCWTDEEKQFLSDSKIYFLDAPYIGWFSNYHLLDDRKHVVKESYNNLRGPDWPTLKEFVNGADPHPDMLTKQLGQFMSYRVYANRDGHHNNYDVNKKYANYLYQQWKQNNESQKNLTRS